MVSLNRQGMRRNNNNNSNNLRENIKIQYKKRRKISKTLSQIKIRLSRVENLQYLLVSTPLLFLSFSNKYAGRNLFRLLRVRRILQPLYIESHLLLRSCSHIVSRAGIRIRLIRWLVLLSCIYMSKRVLWRGKFWLEDFMALELC